MGKYIITEMSLKTFESYLKSDEKSVTTVKKYMRDIKAFIRFANRTPIDKNLIMEYKEFLKERYAVSSANSMLAALNSFLRFENRGNLCVKQFKIQKRVYCSEESELTKEEYTSLIKAAESQKNKRLSLIIQTICGTGIRVSELCFITVEALKSGEATVCCKGKTRTVFIVSALRKKLLYYTKEQGVFKGAIFITKNGKPMDRSNIWREMKALCKSAGVSTAKVFPHNLRHLFARTFYRIEKDIAKLADILGHSNINTTRIYIITTGIEHKRKMESMRLII